MRSKPKGILSDSAAALHHVEFDFEQAFLVCDADWSLGMPIPACYFTVRVNDEGEDVWTVHKECQLAERTSKIEGWLKGSATVKAIKEDDDGLRVYLSREGDDE